jgi:hypothetical protein
MKGHWCRCCGLGVAFANFSGPHAHLNFYSAHVHTDWAEDGNGWLVSNPSQINDSGIFAERLGAFDHSPWLGYTSQLPIHAELRRFSYKVDTAAQRVRIKIRFRMNASLSWTWELEYELTYQDYDEFMAAGRLRLNDYQISATHSGAALATAGGGTVATNTQSGWGDIMLVYPKFGEDWGGKKLRVTAATDTPVKNTNDASPVYSYGVFEDVPIDLSWLVGINHEFVFNDSTFVELATEVPELGVRPRYYESELSGTGYESFKARHYSIVENIFNGPSNSASPTTPPEAYPRIALELSFDFPATIGSPQLAEDVSMRWQISHIWWKAFENNGVVVTTEHKSPATGNNLGFQAPVATPVLFTRSLGGDRWGLAEFDQADLTASVFPITYTLSLLPLS